MIFSTKNEDDTPLWKLVLAGKKTVTRRARPEPVDAIRAVQPKRCMKSLGKINIISCVPDDEWCAKHIPAESTAEAKREGFKKWENLWDCINRMYKKGLPVLYRIEFYLCDTLLCPVCYAPWSTCSEFDLVGKDEGEITEYCGNVNCSSPRNLRR